MSRYKKQQNPYYQGDLIFIFGVFLIISVAAIYAAGQFGQYGGSAWMKQIVFYVIGAGFIGLLLYFDLEQLEKLSLYVLIARRAVAAPFACGAGIHRADQKRSEELVSNRQLYPPAL